MGGFVANNNILPAPPASALPENCIVIEDEQSQANQSRPQPTYRPAVQGIPPKTPTASRPSNIRQQAPTLSMPNIPLSVNFGEKVEYSDRNRVPPRTPKPRSRIGNITPSADILGPGGNVAVPTPKRQGTVAIPTPKRQVRQEPVFMKPEREVPNVSVSHHVENNKQSMYEVPKITFNAKTSNQESLYEDRRVPCTNVDIGSFSSFQNIENSFYDQYDSTTTQSYNVNNNVNNNMNNNMSNSNFSLTGSNKEIPRVHEKQTEAQLVPDTTNSTDFVSGFQRFEGLFPSDSQDSVESFKLNLPSVEDGEPVCPLLDENNAPPPVAYHKENMAGGGIYDGQYRQKASNDNPSGNRGEYQSEVQVGYTDDALGGSTAALQAVGPSVGRFDRFIESDVSSAPVVGHSVTHTDTFSNESSRQRNMFGHDDPTPHSAFKGVENVSRSLFTEEAASPFDVFAHSLQPSKNDLRRTNDSRGINPPLMGPSSNGQFNRDFNSPFQNIQPPGSGRFGLSDPRQQQQPQHQQQQHPHRRSFWQQPRELPQQAVKAFAVSPTVRNNDNHNNNNNLNNNHNINNVNHHQNSINRNINNMNNYSHNNSNQHSTPRNNNNYNNNNNNNNNHNAYSYHDNDGTGGGWDTQQGSWAKAPSECKKRKLGFKKVPGAKGGQTKLTFV